MGGFTDILTTGGQSPLSASYLIIGAAKEEIEYIGNYTEGKYSMKAVKLIISSKISALKLIFSQHHYKGQAHTQSSSDCSQYQAFSRHSTTSVINLHDGGRWISGRTCTGGIR